MPNLIVGGVIFTPLVPQVVLAVVLTLSLSFVLVRLNFFRLVWHRPLVEVSIFCIILGVLVVLTPQG